MSERRRELGARGERIAAEHLRKRGYDIRESNYRCPLGEIDLVAQHGDCLVFVEVRTRRKGLFGPPEESITPAKAARLAALAEAYIASHTSLPSSWRIDLVAVELSPSGKVERIEIIESAIEG